MKRWLPFRLSVYFLGSIVLKSSSLTLWNISISHVFTRFCTFSSSDPGGHIFHQIMKETCQKNSNEEWERERERYFGSALFKDFVDSTIVRRSPISPFGVLLFFSIQIVTVIIFLNSWWGHLNLLKQDNFWAFCELCVLLRRRGPYTYIYCEAVNTSLWCQIIQTY